MGETYEVKQRLTFWQKVFVWMVIVPVCLALLGILITAGVLVYEEWFIAVAATLAPSLA